MDFDALADRLRPSGALLAAQIALADAIERDAVAATELDPTTVDLLLRLSLAPEQRLRAVELCAQLLKSPSHVSRLLDRNEAAGLVARVPDPDDRRASQVQLTAPGAAVVERFVPDLVGVLDRTIHEVLEPSEIGTLVDLLTRIEQASDRAERRRR